MFGLWHGNLKQLLLFDNKYIIFKVGEPVIDLKTSQIYCDDEIEVSLVVDGKRFIGYIVRLPESGKLLNIDSKRFTLSVFRESSESIDNNIIPHYRFPLSIILQDKNIRILRFGNDNQRIYQGIVRIKPSDIL